MNFETGQIEGVNSGFKFATTYARMAASFVLLTCVLRLGGGDLLNGGNCRVCCNDALKLEGVTPCFFGGQL